VRSTGQTTTGALGCISIEDAVGTLRRLDPEGTDHPKNFKRLIRKTTACFKAMPTANMGTHLEFVDTDPNGRALPTVIVQLASGQNARKLGISRPLRVEGEYDGYDSTPEGQRDRIFNVKGRVLDN